MKHTRTALGATLTMAAFVLAAIFGSCKKGDVGPAGPAGSTGASGTPGTNGTNGNANVRYGTISIGSWGWNSSAHVNYSELTWGAVTQGIVDSGAVIGYYTDVSGQWAPMPYTYPKGTVTVEYTFTYSAGSIMLLVYNNSQVDVSSSLTPLNYKFLVISSAVRKANPNTDWKNYTDVKKINGIKEIM